jgi:hypothetical protein
MQFKSCPCNMGRTPSQSVVLLSFRTDPYNQVLATQKQVSSFTFWSISRMDPYAQIRYLHANSSATIIVCPIDVLDLD